MTEQDITAIKCLKPDYKAGEVVICTIYEWNCTNNPKMLVESGKLYVCKEVFLMNTPCLPTGEFWSLYGTRLEGFVYPNRICHAAYIFRKYNPPKITTKKTTDVPQKVN